MSNPPSKTVVQQTATATAPATCCVATVAAHQAPRALTGPGFHPPAPILMSHFPPSPLPDSSSRRAAFTSVSNGMDVTRAPEHTQKRQRRRWLIAAGAVGALGLAHVRLRAVATRRADHRSRCRVDRHRPPGRNDPPSARPGHARAGGNPLDSRRSRTHASERIVVFSRGNRHRRYAAAHAEQPGIETERARRRRRRHRRAGASGQSCARNSKASPSNARPPSPRPRATATPLHRAGRGG